jgi:predicted  nucleic acid-binding Zn-ribbon protein
MNKPSEEGFMAKRRVRPLEERIAAHERALKKMKAQKQVRELQGEIKQMTK